MHQRISKKQKASQQAGPVIQKKTSSSGAAVPMPSSRIAQLQQTAGNRAVAQLLQTQDSESATPQASPNRTGLPDQLKSGVEQLSGMSMDDVKVHYNSSKPSQLNALAYAQGSQIHVGPGQEKHLPHEAWHVVQQKQGRVKPTTQMGDVDVNDNPSLEGEADRMGASAARSGTGVSSKELADVPAPSGSAQLFTGANEDNLDRLKKSRTASGNDNMQLDHSVSQDMMKKLAATAASIGEMVQPSATQYVLTKAAYTKFSDAAKPEEGESGLKNTLLNLKKQYNPRLPAYNWQPGLRLRSANGDERQQIRANPAKRIHPGT
ncbi:eCIS core domain-containing protein [Paenibacillus gorillae]|uniref:eCIS core domain-containing protein n=1 Tax=Paenibacillus gorillae TaxID=1243662 RepID=UPI0004B701CA|nr:DUF4157 domain-containing protein [Paenibacillus gorillae]